VVPRLVEHEGLTVLGIAAVTSNALETNQATARIGELWARFYREDIPGRLPRKATPAVPFGVCTNYESDDTGQYELTVGMSVDASAPTPEGLVRRSIPPGRYLLFEAEGDMPGIVINAWKDVWSQFSKTSDHVRAYTTDFELYRGPRAVAIYISVR
jgi:predicted transcriptional regulator YdeE